MLSLLVSVLVFALILAIVWLVISALPIPALWPNIIIAVVALIFLIGLLERGGVGFGI